MQTFKKIMSIVLLICLTTTFIPSPYVNSYSLTPTTTSSSAGTGNYSVTVPNETDSTYDVRLAIIRKYEDGTYVKSSNEVYSVKVLDSSNNVNKSLSGYYKFWSNNNFEHNYPEIYATIPNVPNGSKVLVEHIKVEDIEFDSSGNLTPSSYNLTYVAAGVANTDPEHNNIVLIDDDTRLKQLEVGQTKSQTTKTEPQTGKAFVRETYDTLLSISNQANYDGIDFIKFLLNNYNVVSLDKINSTHIVGPIISQFEAQRTAENGSINGFLAAADYTNGVPSYIGDFTYYLNYNAKSDVGVKLNYGFDITQNKAFKQPYLYTNKNNLLIKVTGDGNNKADNYVLGDGTVVISSNNVGHTATYQNDNFIDFVKLEAALKQSSKDILTIGNAENSKPIVRFEFDTNGTIAGSVVKVYEGNSVTEITSTNGATYDGRNFSSFVTNGLTLWDKTRLNINMEESWTIINADNLFDINLIKPIDYDYYENPYLNPTTINFACEYINPDIYNIDMNGDWTPERIKHSRMPQVYVDGALLPAIQGVNGEYGEVGNKIIWNMPNVKTNTQTGDNRLSTVGSGQNIPGHIIAPSAEFWNYNPYGGWNGGNLNGGAIVKSFNSGIMEMHMWAYNGRAEKATIFGVKALKTLNGNKPEQEYAFILDILDEQYQADGTIPSGIMNNIFPIKTNSSIVKDEEGAVKFSSIAFDKAGTYSFVVYEDTSMDTPTDNVEYDLTKYKIDIEVGAKTDEQGNITYVINGAKKYKLTDRDGVAFDEPQLLTEDPNVTEFTFDNRTTSKDRVDLKFIKQSTTGHLLSGAKFYVSETTSETDESRPLDGYYELITTDDKGVLNITGLKKDTYYKMWEHEAPNGYELAKGYWIFYVDYNGFLTSIKAYENAQEIKNNVIINEKIRNKNIDITLTKKNQFGSVLDGVEFNVHSVVVDEFGIPQKVYDDYNVDYTSTADGTFTVTDLEADNTYMIKETNTLIGYVEHTGYWLIFVAGDKNNPTADLTYQIIEYDENHKQVGTVENNIIINEKKGFELPTTGGAGNRIFYIIGLVLMFGSFVIYKIRSIKLNDKYKRGELK